MKKSAPDAETAHGEVPPSMNLTAIPDSKIPPPCGVNERRGACRWRRAIAGIKARHCRGKRTAAKSPTPLARYGDQNRTSVHAV
jgi:hypothetical protein